MSLKKMRFTVGLEFPHPRTTRPIKMSKTLNFAEDAADLLEYIEQTVQPHAVGISCEGRFIESFWSAKELREAIRKEEGTSK